MGCFPAKMSGCSCNNNVQTTYIYREAEAKPKSANPDPSNFKIKKYREIGDFLIVKIKYPNCKNYEGDKILVYKGVNYSEFSIFRRVDPHFCEDCISPIARFEPTDDGFNMAIILCEGLSNSTRR